MEMIDYTIHGLEDNGSTFVMTGRCTETYLVEMMERLNQEFTVVLERGEISYP